MFGENDKDNKGKVNYKKLNEILNISHGVLKALYILVIIACISTIVIIFEKLHIFKFITSLIGMLSPLFIGLVVAWIFNPVVNWLNKKGIKRIFCVLSVYIVLIGVMALLIGSILPILYDQIVGFAKSIPTMLKGLENMLDTLLDKLSGIDGIDITQIKSNIFSKLDPANTDYAGIVIENAGKIGQKLLSGLSTFGVGLIIGFFFLLSFENVGETLIGFVPKKHRKETEKLTNSINESLRNYLVGIAIDASVVFVICSIAFSLTGLRAPLLFAVFCAITNVIPFIGPYIGAIPALIVGFSMSPTIGLLTGLAIVIIQFFEGNFLQEMIMSKTTKLHPVTIIMGLLIFGHYWGMIGMVVSTPLIAIIKQIYTFFDEKYDFFKNNDKDRDDLENVSKKVIKKINDKQIEENI